MLSCAASDAHELYIVCMVPTLNDVITKIQFHPKTLQDGSSYGRLTYQIKGVNRKH